MKRHVSLSVGLSLLAMGAAAQPQKIGDWPEASNMELLGWSDLQARSAHQIAEFAHADEGRTHAHTGMHILQLGGEARLVAGFK